MADWNRDTLWRQGHLVNSSAAAALGLQHGVAPDQTVVIVASHDCDLAQAPEGEPRVEVVVGRLLTEREDGNCTHAKNARKLHLEFSNAGLWGEFEATAKTHVDKLALSQFEPRKDATLSAEGLSIFQMWLASRYRRSAFPDEFERRLTSKEFKLHEKIAKAVKPHGALLAGLFFDVDEGADVSRIGEDDTYTLDITVLHAADPFAQAEQAAMEAAQAIERAFKEKLFDPTKSWKHIELRSCEPVSEAVLSYYEFKLLKRWRLDHISLAAEPQQPALAE